MSEFLTPAVARTRQISRDDSNSLNNMAIRKLCTVLAWHWATVLKGPRGPRTQDEEIMLKSNKNNALEGAVSIASNGAAARCALGLLVVVVLLLSNH